MSECVCAYVCLCVPCSKHCFRAALPSKYDGICFFPPNYYILKNQVIQAVPCLADGKNLVSLLMIPCFLEIQRLPWSQSCRVMQIAIANTSENQLSCNKRNDYGAQLFAWLYLSGRGVCGVLCQLAHELFNYLAQWHQMKPTDLWIHPLPIYQKTIKASLSALCTKRPCAVWPSSSIPLLCLEAFLSL